MEEEETVLEVLDPNPDILALFCHYNDIYFHSKLHTCTVGWSSSRMTLCAGICKYTKGSCEIRLSEPLLKFQSSAELKATLLHEMIHAYLWLTDSNKDHEDHGPRFQKMMQAINDSQAVDHQRPEGGYHITIYHEFSNEVDSYRKHHWMCTRCGDLIKRAHNRAPSQTDCHQKIGQDNACINKLCHWHNHQQHCGGNYDKIAEPEGYKDRRPKSCRNGKNSAAENKAVKGKKHILKKNKGILDSSTCDKTKNREGSTASTMQKGASLEMYFATSSNGMRELKTAAKSGENCGDISTEKEGGRKTQKRSRDYKGDETEVNGFSLTVNGCQSGRANNFENVFVQKDKCTVVIGWKGWYAFESEEDEKNIKALKNKRSQRRMLDRACCQVQDPVLGISAIQSSFSGNREMVNSEKIKALHDYTPSEPLLEDWDFGSMQLDCSRECYSVTYSSAKLIHTKIAENPIFSYAFEKESPGKPSTLTIASESLSAVVPSCQETLASFSVRQTSLIDCEDCTAQDFANIKESKTVSLNKNGHKKIVTEEARSGKDLQLDDMEGGSIDKRVIKKIQHKGRSKRLRKGGRFSTERGPSAACPICQRILSGDVEDANFSSRFNEHIDTCMGTSGT